MKPQERIHDAFVFSLSGFHAHRRYDEKEHDVTSVTVRDTQVFPVTLQAH